MACSRWERGPALLIRHGFMVEVRVGERRAPRPGFPAKGCRAHLGERRKLLNKEALCPESNPPPLWSLQQSHVAGGCPGWGKGRGGDYVFPDEL